MPRNQFQKMFFAFVTVIVTVHAYVFYSLYVIHGTTFMESTGAAGILEAINMMGGVPVFGKNIPIWAVVVFKFVFRKDLEKRKEEAKEKEAHGEKLKPQDETEAIADIYKRVDEIKEELKRELEEQLHKNSNI